ncbi:uncharacterized protein [Fopius arisanus]|uniref:IRS-type PTB domain-containing protein n=2 Tax=Fopius arisanus TaxID=64838 RepID=A0A9R1TAX7_9HYME|nr:PREDICTED: uncharacterized protein LOC105268306 [Fopius arisanus]
MVDNNCIIEGNVKFRDGKKWKSRWCVMRKLSPVADCLHLQLYGDSKDRYKQGQTKASLSLQHFLGIESGLTLDKESNTVAIICQDLIVVLAFDTRERLIQWQVKISSNLGDDQQFLVLISTAPAKAKVSTGPAHLHIQDGRFCITVGVPPRLIGVWEIGHLRRYGVVEGRFCFEGGSRCGRGEGLHVLITDQGDDIVKALQLAAEGKLSRKRPIIRELSVQDSPRRQFSRSDTRASDFFPPTVYSTTYKDDTDLTKTETSPCWSSTESRHNVELDGDYREVGGSINELTDKNESLEWRSTLPRQHSSVLERCASCISKLGAVSKTSTFITNSTHTSMNTSVNPPKGFDRISLSSYSTSSHDSDYSTFPSNTTDTSAKPNSIITKTDTSVTKSNPSVIKSNPSVIKPNPSVTKPNPNVTAESPHAPPKDTVDLPLPPRPPSTRLKPKKPPMPLPDKICTCTTAVQTPRKPDPYDNYDIPKTILAHHMSLEPPQTQDQYYDTPRKIKECLALPKNQNYPNYDTPYNSQAVVLQQCGCPSKLPAQSPRSACPCHNVMSWAGFVLPYCRRGAGIESGVTVHPIKLSGQGKMPVVNASGEVAIYPLSKGAKTDITTREEPINNNYENLTPVIETQPESKSNYVNIDFSESLEHYENSRDVITKSGITQEEIQEIACELKPDDCRKSSGSTEKIKDDEICTKCGHMKENSPDYLLMDPDKQLVKKAFSSYLPMQPAHNHCSKEVLSRIYSGTKSSSNPTLFGPPVESTSTRKRSDSELRIPGSAMLSSPYLRRRLIDPAQAIESSASLEILWRKRSYSAESAHYQTPEESPGFSSALEIHKCPSETSKTVIKNEESACQPFSIKIRRSSSVPSKTGHNRDSSSSNDSGVSTGSLSHRNAEFVEFELSLAPINSTRKQNILTVCRKSPPPICYHSSLPRKSKSSDPLRELSFQFQKIQVPTKSSSAEGEIPGLPKATGKGFSSPGEASGTPYIDSRSTSSGTSDMSDYIETLSLSSHSSSDAPDSLRGQGGRAVTTTLRPRSGKEYYKIDRAILNEQARSSGQGFPNITPVMEKSESPSPGYMSSSPFEQPQTSRQRFLFPDVSDI